MPEKLYFCVVRDKDTTNTTLLELELKLYFKEHNAQNVTVLGLPSLSGDSMSELYKKMLSMPAGSWMVDELVMTDPKDHAKWAKELQQMRGHIVGQLGGLLLWISIAGISDGKPEHFKQNYLAPLMPGFHMPKMEIPLRNTSEVLKLATLDSKDVNKTAGVTYRMVTNPTYSLPPNLMSGIQCRQIKVKNGLPWAGMVEAACKEMLVRTGGKGFPILVQEYVSASSMVHFVQRALGATLLYTYDGIDKYGASIGRKKTTEADVEEWVRRWKRGEEKRVLLTDDYISRGWEAKDLLVIGSAETENLVMRASGFCFLIKPE